MLPKQLKFIKDFLNSLEEDALTEQQQQLLSELEFINNHIDSKLLLTYKLRNKLFESFAVSDDLCPSCGKRL